MDLSIIVVNYNVEHFLEQCLYAVKLACKDLKTEIFVVDNNSVDGSVEMVKQKFPDVKLIENKKNSGFSCANNQAMRLATGRYFLLLNPDTIVEEDTFVKVVSFMDTHPEAGGLGVNMVDGKGNFLPESKRGLPTPMVALYKITGLSKLFPNSKIFGRYHLGFLSRDEINEVDILSGAFMLMRKEALDKVGLLDETFFMYGEDIDLSYRIQLGGYKNYYFPETRIIHYKGESTKKSSINYIFVFYRAMAIFAKKHFSPNRANLFSILINFAIWIRASLSILKRFVKSIITPLIDATLLYGGFYLIRAYWEKHVLLDIGHFPQEYLYFVMPIYILIWIISIWINGGYDRPIRLLKVFQGMIVGTITILVLYALLPESSRFSRAMILFGAGWGIIATMGWRTLLGNLGVKAYKLQGDEHKRIAVIGNEIEAKRVAEMLQHTRINPGFTGVVSIDEKRFSTSNNSYLGNVNQLKDIVEIYKLNELVFCGKDLPAQSIISYMSDMQESDLAFKIAPPESASIIGSNSIHTSGDLYVINVNTINHKNHKRNKRFFDIISSLFLFLLSPIFLFFMKNKMGFFKNIFLTFFGKLSWVGFFQTENGNEQLPMIKRGVLTPIDAFPDRKIDEEAAHTLNLLYARDYAIRSDINIILKSFWNLGKKAK